MARIRTIKPEFWQDEKLMPLSDTARLLFLGLISMADDYGRLVYNPKLIEALLFDPDGPDRSRDVRECLANLSRIGRVIVGKASSGQRVLQIVNWEKHQKVDKPNKSAALPEIVEVQELTEFANDSRMIRDGFANDSRPIPTTNDQYQRPTTTDPRAPRDRSAPKAVGGKYPHFAMAVSDAGYNTWLAKLGATDYATFRKEFAPIFNIPEADRPAALPRDSEFTRIIELYAVAIRGTRAQQFAKPKACAEKATQLAAAAREPDTERRIYMARTACGTVEEQRRLEMAA